MIDYQKSLGNQKRANDLMKAREARYEKRKKEKKRIERKTRTKKSKYLYLMKDDANGYYKIGISHSCKYREKTLQSAKPTIKLVGKWRHLDKYERAWHDYFYKYNTRGEWFNLSKVQVEFFTKSCVSEKGPPENKIKVS